MIILFLYVRDFFHGAKHFPVELEFARLELDCGLTSKRKINALVEAGKWMDLTIQD